MGLRHARRPFTYVLGLISLFTLCSCHLSYVIESAYYQVDLLSRRVPIDKALQDPGLPPEAKQKLRLIQEAREFAESALHLKKTKNYGSFVQLQGPYVTYAVQAAPRWELASYLWSFPIVGHVPYLGFFRKEKALSYADSMSAKGFDTYVRGISAYSTLGWFNDPVLSSMLTYDDYDLVNTIIHETVHATIYYKCSADFNEQLATFVGNRGAELFYQNREGSNSATLGQIRHENEDDRLFAKFISHEVENLKAWYKTKPDQDESARQKRLGEIQERFKSELGPQLKTAKYGAFTKGAMNNARLLIHQTYLGDYTDFEKTFVKLGGDFKRLVEFCKGLQKEKDAALALRRFAHETSQAAGI